MSNFKSLTIWTIVLSFFNVVGAGHGIGFVGLIELFWLKAGFVINSEYFSLSLTASYDKSLGAVALFSLIGHTILILSLLIKGYRIKFWLQIVGIIILWVGFYYLTHNLFSDELSLFSFSFGIPFLICSGVLFYKILYSRKQSFSKE